MQSVCGIRVFSVMVVDADFDAFVAAAADAAFVLDRLETKILQLGSEPLGAAGFFASRVGVGYPSADDRLALRARWMPRL